MLQLEAPHYQFALAPTNASDTTRGPLTMLSDSEMSRFSEFLEGCPPALLDRISSSRSSSFAETHTHHPLEHEHDHPLRHLHQHDHEHHLEAVPQYVHDHAHTFPPPSGTDVDALAGSNWTSAAVAVDGESMAPSFPLPLHNSVSFASAFDRDVATCAVTPYLDAPCWLSDHGAPSGDSATPLTVDVRPSSHGDFSHFALSSFEHEDKSDATTESPSMASLDAPSPAHMEQHFLPYVHHVEADMMFPGMGSSNAPTHPSYYDSREQQQHYVQPQHFVQRQHGLHEVQERLFYPACMPVTSDSASFERLKTLQHHEQQHSFMLQLDGVTSASHVAAMSSRGDGTAWRASEHLAPTQIIASDTSKSSSSPPSATQAPTRAVRSRTLRGRVSATAPARGAFRSAPAHTMNVQVRSSGASTRSSGRCGDAAFPAQLRLLTALSDCYWKNGRKNLQCFPVCPEHNDFYSMKMNNRKHSSVGVCRGPVYCHVITQAAASASVMTGVTDSTSSGRHHRQQQQPPPLGSRVAGPSSSSPSALSSGSTTSRPQSMALAALPTIPSGQHMKYEHGIGASSSGGSARELFVLGRFERVPQRDNSDLVGELSLPPEFASSAAFEEFRYGCFQAVEMKERRVHGIASELEGTSDSASSGTINSSIAATSSGSVATVRSTWFFLPDVWKVQPMLKKKRKATRSAPAQTFPFCFRVFVYTANPSSSSSSGGGNGGYLCVASSASTFFELYSTRTVDRVKRKYWSKPTSDDASCTSSSSRCSSALKRQRCEG